MTVPKRDVVFVHGLWMTGLETLWLARRVGRRLGAGTRTFNYRSVAASASTSAATLGRMVWALDAEVVDLVGHSLGGIVILKLLQAAPALPPGRVVLLGAPLQGSRAALALARGPGGRQILGRANAESVLEPGPRDWVAAREVGVIAGTAPYGLGRLIARLDGTNDGVVLLEETRFDGARDHLALRVNHSGMLFSRTVAEQTAAFLADGRFARGGRATQSPASRFSR